MKDDTKIHIHHIITSMGRGGAEGMLLRLLDNINKSRFVSEVTCLTDNIEMREEFFKLGIKINFLNMKKNFRTFKAIFDLFNILKESRPHIVQTWMYHSDLIGGLTSKLSNTCPIIWNVRHCNLHPKYNKKSTIYFAKLCGIFSKKIPTKIIFCAESAKSSHLPLGYSEEKIIVIPNGYDTEKLMPITQEHFNLKKRLIIPDENFIIGMVARWDPLKDHKNFVEAASILNRYHKNVSFVLCGSGIRWDNDQLSKMIFKKKLEKNFFLLGSQPNVHKIIQGLEISTLSSCGEAFPNVLAESMSCGVPCVSTNVGDSERILGQTGFIVPPKDPMALASAWKSIIELDQHERKKLGLLGRQRILETYSIKKIVREYENLYEKLHCKKFIRGN